MTGKRQPKCLASLISKRLPNSFRTAFDIPEYLLISNYDDWSIDTIINDYFLVITFPDSTGHELYIETIHCLNDFKESGQYGTKNAKSYAGGFYNYLIQVQKKKEFLHKYATVERARRLEISREQVQTEVEIAANDLITEHLKKRSMKRRIEDIESLRPVSRKR